MPSKVWTKWVDEAPKLIGFKLSAAPIDPVTVSIKIKGDFVLNDGTRETSLEFTALNWNTPQGLLVGPTKFPGRADVEACASSAYYMTKPTCAAPIELKKKCGVPWFLSAVIPDLPDFAITGSVPSVVASDSQGADLIAYGDLQVTYTNKLPVPVTLYIENPGYDPPYNISAGLIYAGQRAASVECPPNMPISVPIWTSAISVFGSAAHTTLITAHAIEPQGDRAVSRQVTPTQWICAAPPLGGTYAQLFDLPNYVLPPPGGLATTPALPGSVSSMVSWIKPSQVVAKGIVTYSADIKDAPASIEYPLGGSHVAPNESPADTAALSGYVCGLYADISHGSYLELGGQPIAGSVIYHSQSQHS